MRQTSIRLAPATERQIEALTNAGWGTQSEIIKVAIDRMYEREMNQMPYYVNHNKHGQISGGNQLAPSNVQANGAVVTWEGQPSTRVWDEVNQRGLVSHTHISIPRTLYCVSPAAAEEVAKIIAANPCYERL